MKHLEGECSRFRLICKFSHMISTYYNLTDYEIVKCKLIVSNTYISNANHLVNIQENFVQLN